MPVSSQDQERKKQALENVEGAYWWEDFVWEGERGNFCDITMDMVAVQASTAGSVKDALRGFHCSPYAKVVGCVQGAMHDVLVDMRPESPTFGKWDVKVLTKGIYLYVPPGVGHGYLALEDNTLTLYMKGGRYDPSKEKNVNPFCPELAVPWPKTKNEVLLSPTDAKAPSFSEVCGTAPVQKKCWYAPNKFEAYGEEEILAVTECLRDGWLAPGPRTAEFEKQVAAYFGKKYAIMCNSGSSANLLALAVYQFPPGTEIVTPAMTFSTVLAPIVQLGLKPVFTDVELDTYVPSVQQVIDAVTPGTKMVFIPNLVGSKLDWAALREKLDGMGRSDIVLFEDSCDTMTYTKESDVAVISFYASHIITAAGMGGIAMFNDEKLYSRAFMYRDWGRMGNNSEDMEERFRHKVDGIPYDWKFLYGCKGYNFKANEISAAFGLAQMSKLDKLAGIRKANINRFVERLTDAGTSYILPKDHNSFCWLAMPLQHENRQGVIDMLEANNVQIRVCFAGNITRHPAYREFYGEYENADRIMANAFLVGAHHGMRTKDVDYVCDLLIAYDKEWQKAK